MKVYIIGSNTPVNLGQNNFVAKGGFGSVYATKGLVYKVYTDIKNMIPVEKIKELSRLDNKNIIRPLKVLVNKNDSKVGYTMKEVSGEHMPRMFTNDFWKRENISFDIISKLVQNIKETIDIIHLNHCLIIDGNELNYIVDKKDYTTAYFLDVDSYQTPSYPATAIMPSIRDYKTKGFSTLTDWYSFAVVTFQLFTGVHPFKGKHPKYKKRDFEQRVIDCVSVLNPDTTYAPSVRDFKNIPSNYFDWYNHLFEEGDRIPPPNKLGTIQAIKAQVKVVIKRKGDNFIIDLVKKYDESILYYKKTDDGIDVVKTSDGKQEYIYINNEKYDSSKNVEVAITPKSLSPIFVKIEDGVIKAKSLNKEINVLLLHADDFMVINNIVFLKKGGTLTGVEIKEFNSKIMFMPSTSFNIMPKSSKMFSGLLYQSVLGVPYLVIPYVEDNKIKCAMPQVQELNNMTVIDAKHDKHVVIIIAADNSGNYKRFILRFDHNYTDYDYRIIEEQSLNSINFVVTKSGVVTMINEDGMIEMFLNDPSKDNLKQILDKTVNDSVKLCYLEGRVGFIKDNAVYSLKSK